MPISRAQRKFRMPQRPKRTPAQKIGSRGHRWAMAEIEKSAGWVARSLDEDFGIDAEAEYMPGEARGDILKLQFKSKERALLRAGMVQFSLNRRYLNYARSCRYPVIFVVIDVHREQAWYLWLQQWIFENRNNRANDSDSRSITVWVSDACTLRAGLDGELRSIAQWRGPTQLALSLMDAFRAAMATDNRDVVGALTGLLERVAPGLPGAVLDDVIEQGIRLGAQLWATATGNTVAEQLYGLVRKFGNHMNLAAVDAMVSRGESYSRTGINALAVLYDYYFDHASSLGLVEHFGAKDVRVAFFCALRQSHPQKSGFDWMEVPAEFMYGGLRFEFDDSASTGFHDKFANRGPSAILDYLTSNSAHPRFSKRRTAGSKRI